DAVPALSHVRIRWQEAIQIDAPNGRTAGYRSARRKPGLVKQSRVEPPVEIEIRVVRRQRAWAVCQGGGSLGPSHSWRRDKWRTWRSTSPGNRVAGGISVK